METVTFSSTFMAYLHELSLTSGRLKFVLKDAPVDVAQAATLAYVLDKVLSVTVYQGTGEEPVCAFLAIIPRIQRGLHFAGGSGQVHFEVPETHHREMIRLIGHEERLLRLEIGVDGDAPSKKKSKGDHGYFWRNLIRHGFEGHPDMLEVWHQLRITNNREPDYPADKLLRDCFSVASRAEIAPARLREWLRIRQLHKDSGVWLLIDQAERGL